MSTEPWYTLIHKHKAETCYIVGKGPSLLYLLAKDFGPGPIITLNQAILVVQQLGLSNPIYSLQKDAQPWYMVEPRDDITLILQEAYGFDWYPDHPHRILVDPVRDMKLRGQGEMSIRMAIWLAVTMACREIVFVSCDNLVNGSEQRTDVESHKIDESFRNGHLYTQVRDLVLQDVAEIPHRFVMPGERT